MAGKVVSIKSNTQKRDEKNAGTKSETRHILHGDRGDPYHSCTWKHFRIRRTVSSLRGAENLEKKHLHI